MGRMSQLFWFLNMDPLPARKDRDFIFTSLDVEMDWVKDLRKKRLSEVRKSNDNRFEAEGTIPPKLNS